VDVGVLTRESGGSIQQPDPEGNVRFRIEAAGAREVLVAGDFNDWTPESTPLHPVGSGWWEAVIELEPGVYEYSYVIDGEWKTPPEAKLFVNDGFGGRNGILEVLPPDL
jgi:1,4-alpha-glucan branching enzyme